MENETCKVLIDSIFFAVFLLDDQGKVYYAKNLGQKFIAENGTAFTKQVTDQFTLEKTDSNVWAKISPLKLADVDVVGSASHRDPGKFGYAVVPRQ